MRVVVADDSLLPARASSGCSATPVSTSLASPRPPPACSSRPVRTTTPDVAIVDIKMPPTHTDEGLVAAQRIRSDHPGVGVLVLSQYIEPSYAMPLPAPRDIRNRHLVGVAEWILTLQ